MPFLKEERPDWERDGHDWPNRAASRFVEAGTLRWHVQEFGARQAPVLLLLHGIGAATHSWRTLAPLLAKDFRVIAPDLPGHGFSDPLPAEDLSLPGIARAVAGLLRTLDVPLAVAAGHSAGAALLCRMCLDGTIDPRLLIALNGALAPSPGAASRLFPPMARMLFRNAVTPKLLAWVADRAAVKRLIDRTGSRLDATGLDLYKLLLARSGHVAGALGMMTNWDLEALGQDLPALKQHLLLVVGSEDRAILPETGFAVRDRLRDARVELMSGLGHLAHEEAPERVAELLVREARSVSVLAPGGAEA
ncbi:alpha/beta fold hydrolase BchO [Methylobacterium gnaphalii]|uniref:Alpha/beta hydrolase n=1 Tax=Methylobacterium gnaphalii TaxID=1010610 RepID=A0A512JN34_9HYPH|nr:alpha/beta fold hydrolase BchO [Methylobacterium gnaphalii]GEP11369.1 alpha/beta hydrolase [Methylobacterium gnaphalii]GJD71401.1 2-succinyl-6-hydroxy-2, 4-cyclohexadiene-1-carboxylate synthase [Methylobacterium gnaphalii]GLS47963.1 alpha/beta hydrolase [Methylobacterium gnaphalii]